MKEERIYLGMRDYSLSHIIWASIIGKINARAMPTLAALGLCDNVEADVDVATKGVDELKRIFKKKFLEAHPTMLTVGLEFYADYEVERTVNAACKEFKFNTVDVGILSDKEAERLKKIAIIKDRQLAIDVEKLKESHKVFATGEDAKLYKEIEAALKALNKVFRGHLDRSTFNDLFYWGDDGELHFNNVIKLSILKEIRGIKA